MAMEWWEYPSDPLYGYSHMRDSYVNHRNIRIDMRFSLRACSKSYLDQYRQHALPIAEVLCLLNNGSLEHYEDYMEQACELYLLSIDKGEFSWVTDLHHENASVADAWAQWRMMKSLSQTYRP